jgi:hypothetical protein
MPACDDLYLQAPWGSDLEAFGESCGDRRVDRSAGAWCEDSFGTEATSEEPTELSPDEKFLVLSIAFDGLSAEQQRILCADALRDMSAALAAGSQIAEASSGTVTADEAAAFLRTVC